MRTPPARAATPPTASEDKDATDPAPLPDADAVLARAVEALGGRQALEAIETVHARSTIEVQGQPLSANVELWWHSGDLYVRSEMPGLGVSEIWKRGSEAWASDPLQGKRQLDEIEIRQAELDAHPALLAVWPQFFGRARTTGRRIVAGRAVLDVELSGEPFPPILVSIAEADGLPAIQTTTRQTALGELAVTTWYSDYREIAGVQIPYRSEIDMATLRSTVRVEQIEIGLPIDPTMFAP